MIEPEDNISLLQVQRRNETEVYLGKEENDVRGRNVRKMDPGDRCVTEGETISHYYPTIPFKMRKDGNEQCGFLVIYKNN